MAHEDSKEWRPQNHDNVPNIDAVGEGYKNSAKMLRIQTNSLPNGLPPFWIKSFLSDVVPDNTTYPDSVAPVGSMVRRFIVSGAGVITGSELYFKGAPATWTLFSPGGPDGVNVVDVQISSAELLALNATPQQLVAAPGAGLIIVPVDIQLFLDYNSAAYAGIAAGEDLAVKYTDASGAVLATIETTGFLDQTSDQHRIIQPQQAAWAPVANAPLVLHLLTDEIITGDSPLNVRVRYKVLPIQS